MISLAFGCASLALAGAVFVPKTPEESAKFFGAWSATTYFIIQATLGLFLILWNFVPTT